VVNKTEIAQLLTLASGFDRRVVDQVTVEAWALIPELANADYQDAKAVVVAHQTGPKRTEYLTVGHITDALAVQNRSNRAAIETDVRSAKARGLIDKSWTDKQVLPDSVREALFTLRDTERRTAAQRFAFDELEGNPLDPGDIGKDIPE